LRKNKVCPACGCELDFKPWSGSSASDEICPCCGIQYGYDDCAGGDVNKKQAIHEKWRKNWVADGCKWFSSNPPPTGWNAEIQLSKFQDKD